MDLIWKHKELLERKVDLYWNADIRMSKEIFSLRLFLSDYRELAVMYESAFTATIDDALQLINNWRREARLLWK
jgi:hypothetical protein